jgi:ATP-binding cassette subfamily B protein
VTATTGTSPARPAAARPAPAPRASAASVVARYARPRWRALAVLLALAAAQAGLSAALPWPVKVAVDDVLAEVPGPGAGGPERSQLVGLALAVVGLYAAVEVVKLARRRLQSRVGRQLAVSLAADAFDEMQRASVLSVRRRPVGDTVSRVVGDSLSIQELVVTVGIGATVAVVQLVAYAVVLWRLDPVSAVLAVVVAVPHALVGRGFATPMGDRARRRAELEADVIAGAESGIAGLREVVLNTGEAREGRRFDRRVDGLVTAARSADGLAAVVGAALGGFTAVGTAVVLAVGGLRVQSGSLTVGGLLVVLAYVASLYAPVESLAYLVTSGAGATARLRRIDELTTGIERVVEPVRPVDVPVGSPRIEFRGVWFAYEGGEAVLRGVDLVVPAGATVALVGRTGAGKTTLASLVPRLFDPTRGVVSFDGVDVRDMGLRELRRRVAVVTQDAHLFPVSVAENIAYGRPDASRDEVVAAARSARAHEFIVGLAEGYETALGDGGTSLSGGQRQRIAIARALLKDAPVLLLDEPTSALDTQTEGEVMDAIGRLVADRTVLVIAHRLSTIRLADVVAILDGGRVVEVGPPDELLRTDSAYRRMYEAYARSARVELGAPGPGGATA